MECGRWYNAASNMVWLPGENGMTVRQKEEYNYKSGTDAVGV